jgi:hypothetical protein
VHCLSARGVQKDKHMQFALAKAESGRSGSRIVSLPRCNATHARSPINHLFGDHIRRAEVQDMHKTSYSSGKGIEAFLWSSRFPGIHSFYLCPEATSQAWKQRHPPPKRKH